mgnify:FL=1|tara:strand:- start:1139 stop:2068 length:930 start_codon:yes stop_codon:yes gene_type:complete
MATTTTVSSNYAGKAAGEIIGAAFREADTLRLNLLTVAENVNYKMNLRKIAYTNGTTDYSCGFVPEGAVTLSEKVLQIEKLMNPIQVCKEDFRQTWSEDSMGASASNPNAPADIMEAISMELLASQAEKIDTDIWTGLAATDGEFNGLIEQFTADGSVVKANNGITALGAATTESNVEAHLKAALEAVPVAIRRKDLTVAVSPDVFQAYWFYLVSKGIANDGNAEAKQVRFGRYTITEVNGLPDNTIVIFEPKNVVFATGLQSDMNELSMVDEDSIGLLTGQVRGKLVYGAAVGYYNSEDIVWLLTTQA